MYFTYIKNHESFNVILGMIKLSFGIEIRIKRMYDEIRYKGIQVLAQFKYSNDESLLVVEFDFIFLDMSS